MESELAALLRDQEGVVARRQLRDHGVSAPEIRRLLRRRALVRMLPGVYVDHTGPLSWHQRAWAGVLHAWPAAVAGRAALRLTAGPKWRAFDPDAPIDLVIDHTRRIDPLAGYRVHRRRGLDDRVRWNGRPPRLRVEQAVLDEADRAASVLDVIAIVADACQQGLTKPARLGEALEQRPRHTRRELLSGALEDVAAGACSVLEHRYLRLERDHGLPRGERQAPRRGRVRAMFQDVTYCAGAVTGLSADLVVELDGRLFHDRAAQRSIDLDRDLDTLLSGGRTARLGWSQVYDEPCRTAAAIGLLLQQSGWPRRPGPCGDECRVDASNPARSGSLGVSR